MVYATAFIEQMASLPLTHSSTFLTTKVGAEHIPNTRLLAAEKYMTGNSKIQALGLTITGNRKLLHIELQTKEKSIIQQNWEKFLYGRKQMQGHPEQ